MKKNLSILLSVTLCASLIGCGSGSGNDSQTAAPKHSQIVMFGDSLSDPGAYKVGTIASYGGGKFTVNAPSAKVWIEHVADYFGFDSSCAAETGLPYVLAQLIPFYQGSEILGRTACTNYAQGGARVSNPYAPNSAALQKIVLGASGTEAAMAVAPLGHVATPAADQMDMHLNRIGGSYKGNELVVILVGANDLFMNLNAIASAKDGGQSAGFSALLAGWSEATQAALATETDPTVRVGGAVVAAQSWMVSAARELLTNLKNKVVAKGATKIVVVTIPDVGLTPSMLQAGAESSVLATGLAKTFNETIAAGLASDKAFTGVVLVDSFKESQNQAKDPAAYGLKNTTDVSCGIRDTIVKDSSLGCTQDTLLPGDKSQYLYADGVHPSPLGHNLFAQYFIKVIKAAGLGV